MNILCGTFQEHSLEVLKLHHNQFSSISVHWTKNEHYATFSFAWSLVHPNKNVISFTGPIKYHNP